MDHKFTIGLKMLGALLRMGFTVTTFALGTVLATAQDETNDPGARPQSFDQLLQRLSTTYADQVERASSFRNALSRKPYALTYANETAGSPLEYLGNILYAFQLQDAAIRSKLKQLSNPKVQPKAAANSIVGKAAIKIVASNLSRRCRHCRTSTQTARYQAAVQDYLRVYDLNKASLGYAIPFYGLMQERFNDPSFAAKTIQLQAELQKVVRRFVEDPNYKLDTNLQEIALKVTNGDKKKAIEMLGILMTGETSSISYFDYISAKNPEFVRSVGEIALTTRLIVELDRVRESSKLDRFSYDGQYRSHNIKNYYFWSGSLAALKMAELGHSSEDIHHLSVEFPRQYKVLTAAFNKTQKSALVAVELGVLSTLLIDPGSYETFSGASSGLVMATINGVLLTAGRKQLNGPDPKYFRQDAVEVMRNTAEGARRVTRCLQAAVDHVAK